MHNALADGEFFNPREFEWAADLLREGRARAAALKENKAPWTEAHGLVVRGYRSKLDDSIQPYGLVVPASYTSAGNDKFSLDFWFHGRGENLSEVNFLRDRQKNVGTFSPPDTIVLHPYGRVLQRQQVRRRGRRLRGPRIREGAYRIDDDRIVVRGFSMGGASTWHLAVHYPTLWAAANPGAGFAETPVFAKVFHKESLTPTWWETKLFHWYDATDWAENLWHCPTVAYSGEIDSQKQAADIMAEAMKRYGLELVHVIGPKTKHQYHPQARLEVDRRIAELAEHGRETLPEGVRFTTYTLRYNHSPPGSPSMHSTIIGSGHGRRARRRKREHRLRDGERAGVHDQYSARLRTDSSVGAKRRFAAISAVAGRQQRPRAASAAGPLRSPERPELDRSPSIERGSSGKRDRCP